MIILKENLKGKLTSKEKNAYKAFLKDYDSYKKIQ